MTCNVFGGTLILTQPACIGHVPGNMQIVHEILGLNRTMDSLCVSQKPL